VPDGFSEPSGDINTVDSERTWKQCLIGVLLAIILVIVIVSGCQETTRDDGVYSFINSGFIGSWQNIDTSLDHETWMFSTNGTVQYSVTLVVEGNTISSPSWFNYEVKTDTLCLSPIEVLPESSSSYGECYGYIFSDNVSRFILPFHGTIVFVLVKTQ